MPDVRLAQASIHVDSEDIAQEIALAAEAVNADIDNTAQEIRLASTALQVDARVPQKPSPDEHVAFYLYDRYSHPITILDNVVAASFRMEMNEPGAGELQLLADEKISLIKPWTVIRVRYREMDVFSFYVEQIERQPVGSDRFVFVRGRGLLVALERGIVYDPDYDTVSYPNWPVGAILYDLLQRFHERGGSDLVPTFSLTEDSARKTWSIVASLEFRRGMSLLSVAQELCAYGLELRADPDHTLNAYETMGTDKSQHILFGEGKNIVSITQREDATRQANVVYAIGRGDLVKVQNLSNRVRDGVREIFLQVGNAQNDTQVQKAAERYLQTLAEPEVSFEMEISTHDYVPFVDYHLGDWIKVATLYWRGNYRIMAMDFVIDRGQLRAVRLTCNSVQRDRQERLERAYRLFENQLPSVLSVGLATHDPRRVAYFDAMGPVSALNDVSITTPRASEEVLVYNHAMGTWSNRDLATIGGGMSESEADARYVNVTGDIMTGALGVTRTGGNDKALAVAVEGDNVERFRVTASGALSWGDGSSAHDVTLWRSAANTLQTGNFVVNALSANSVTTDSLSATGAISASSATIASGTITTLSGTTAQYGKIGVNTSINNDFALTVGVGNVGGIRLTDGVSGRLSWSDVYLYRSSTTTVTWYGSMLVLSGTVGIGTTPQNVYQLSLAAGSQAALYLAGTTGTAATGIRFATDTNLYRSAADTLRTDDKMIVMSGMGIGTANPATHLESEQTVTISSTTADGYSAALTLDPRYSATSAQTVARHNYIDVLTPTTTNVTVTDACVFRFNASPGTHKAIDSGTTKASPNEVQAWIKININGTIYYVPAYTSKTA